MSTKIYQVFNFEFHQAPQAVIMRDGTGVDRALSPEGILLLDIATTLREIRQWGVAQENDGYGQTVYVKNQ